MPKKWLLYCTDGRYSAILTENKITYQVQTFGGDDYEENAFFTLRGVRQVEQRLDKYIFKEDIVMMKALKKVNWKKLGIFAGGVLFGTAGIKVLSSKDAKNVYTHCTAGVLRAKDCVMKTANTIQENCGDIYAGAKDINEARAQKAAEADFEDAESTETAEEEVGAEE